MKTKHGEIDSEMFDKYPTKLINKIFKLLPLKEENNPTLNKYIDSFLVELYGSTSIISSFGNNPEFISLICSIEGLKQVEDLSIYRGKIFECIEICKKLI